MTETQWVVEALIAWVAANIAVSARIDWRHITGPDWRALLFAPWYAAHRRKKFAEQAEQRKELTVLALRNPRSRCPYCGLPHDLEGWPNNVCKNVREGKL